MLKVPSMLGALFAAVAVYAGPASAPANSPRYMQCGEKDADVVLTVSVILPGRTFPQIGHVYIRHAKPEDEGAYRSIATMKHACGPDGASAFSIQPDVGEQGIELTVTAGSHSGDASSWLEVKLNVPFLTDRKGQIDGTTYEATWARAQREPNKSPEPTPGSVTPAASAPSAPPPSAAHL